MSYGYQWYAIQSFCHLYNKCISPTVDRGCIMTRVHRRCVMVYESLQVKSGGSWVSSCRVSFSQTGTKLLKLLLLLHYQFLHGGTIGRCNIQTPIDSNVEDLSLHTLQTAQIWYSIIVHPSPKVMADFFQTQKSTWCLHPICTIFGIFIKCMLAVISYEKYKDFWN